jgi:rod shape determining protein RodA
VITEKIINMEKMKNLFKNIDPALLFIVFVILIIAFLSLYSASHQPGRDLARNYSMQQFIWLGLTIIIGVLFIKFGYERWIDYSYLIFALNLLMLLLVFFIGDTRYGARRWIGVGIFSLQPSELCKISFILALTKFVTDNGDRIKEPGTVIASLFICMLPVALIMKQPDLGTAIAFLPIFFVVLFIAGAKIKHLFIIFIMGAGAAPFLWSMLQVYQRKRLLVFLNPNIDPLGAGYTIIQSRIAIGSGGLFGRGWLAGTQNQLNFLPERHTDFIFSVIGEEWGFVGAIILLGLFLLLIRRLLVIADITNDNRGKVLISGIVALIWFQVFVNIGMTIGLMPVVGLPLPLISYGGSNLLTTMIMIALAVSVGLKRKVF